MGYIASPQGHVHPGASLVSRPFHSTGEAGAPSPEPQLHKEKQQHPSEAQPALSQLGIVPPLLLSESQRLSIQKEGLFIAYQWRTLMVKNLHVFSVRGHSSTHFEGGCYFHSF